MSIVSRAGKAVRCYKPSGLLSRTLYISLMCVVFCACQPEEFNTAEELKAFVSEPSNNLSKKVALNGYEIKVSFEPTDLLIYQEIGGGPTDHQRLVNMERKYEDNYYFVIRLTRKEPSSTAEAESSFQDMYGSIFQSLSVTTPEEDTVRSDKFTVETINVLNNDSPEIMIVLSKKKTMYRDWIQFNLNEFGLGIGDHEFKFYIHDLEQVPNLKFEVIS